MFVGSLPFNNTWWIVRSLWGHRLTWHVILRFLAMNKDEPGHWRTVLYCVNLNGRTPTKFAWKNMMTPSNGNIFRVTGPLCGEFTGPGEFPAQRPVTRSFDVFFDLRPNTRLSKQPWGWWFETPSWSWWRHCNEWNRACHPVAMFGLLPEYPAILSSHCNSFEDLAPVVKIHTG